MSGSGVRRIARARGCAAIAFVALAGLCATFAGSAPALAADPDWGTGVAAALPGDAAGNSGVTVSAVSCGAPGDCAAVGRYFDSSSFQQGLLLTESGGKWQTGVKAALPADAVMVASMTSVSCGDVGDCAAVGTYLDKSGRRWGLLLTESGGTWGAGVKAPLPADAGWDPTVSLNSVSCPAAGECAAVGRYTDNSGVTQGLLLMESGGSWATGVKAALPADAGGNPAVLFNSVSCPAAGACTAVGFYNDNAGNRQGLLASATAGTWATGVKASLPGGAATSPFVILNSVSCAAAGECSAAGTYSDSSGDTQGVLLTESGGAWATGVKAALPTDAASRPFVALITLSCAGAGECAAVGSYMDTHGNRQPLILTQKQGTWGTGFEVPVPGDSASDTANVTSVACSATGYCAAVGYYNDTAGNRQGLLVTESGGTWATGFKAGLPADAAGNPGAVIFSVACGAQGECAAVGSYADGASARHALLLDAIPDVTAPLVSLSSPGDGSKTNDNSPAFTGSGGIAQGDEATVTVKIWSGASIGSGSPDYTTTANRDSTTGAFSSSGPFTKVSDSSSQSTLPDGTYTAEAFQSDTSANVGHSSAATVTIETTLPAISLTAPSDGSAGHDSAPRFAGTGGTASDDDPNAIVKIWSGSSVGAGDPDYTVLASVDPSTGAYSTAGPYVQVSDSSSHATLPNGTYTSEAFQSDAFANTGHSAATSFTVDTQNPTSSATAPAATGASSVEVSYTASDNSGGSGLGHVDLYVKGPKDSSYQKAATDPTPAASGHHFTYTPNEGDGNYSYYTRATDKAGNTEAAPTVPDATSVAVDTAKPTSSDTSPVYSNSSSIEVQYTADGTGSALDHVDLYAKGPSDSSYSKVDTDATPATTGHHFTYTPSENDGDYAFYTRATDKAGNTEDAPASADSTTRLDTANPSTSLDGFKTGWQAGDFDVTLSTDDGSGSGVDTTYYVVNSGSAPAKSDSSWQTYSSGQQIALHDGERVHYYSTDKAGNAEAPQTSAPAQVDQLAPTSRASAPATIASSSVHVDYAASDTGGSGLKQVELYVKAPHASSYSLAATGSSAAAGHFDYTATAGDGEYAFYTVAYDSVGNVEATPATPDATTKRTTVVPAIKPPALGNLTLKPNKFRPAGPSSKHHAPPLATTISYTDSAAATTTFTVYQPRAGIQKNGKCVRAPSRMPSQAKKCSRLVAVGSFVHSDKAGPNTIPWSGRLKKNALPAGKYVLIAVPRLSGLSGKGRRATFSIAR